MSRDVTAASTARAVLLAAENEGRTVLLEHEVYAVLAEGGLAVPRHRLVASADHVDAATVEAIGSDEVVVKAVSPQILHKSDVGGVAFCRNEPAAVRDAVASVLEASRLAVPAAEVRGALVAERIAFRGGLGREILAGFRHDPAFGAVVFAGAGGLDTEYLIRVLGHRTASGVRCADDLTPEGAAAMLRGTVVETALRGGLRSAPRAVVAEGDMARLVLSLAAIAARLAGFEPPEGLGLAELEVNPFVVSGDGRIVALDGLARLHRPRPLPRPRPIAKLRRLLTPESAVVIGASTGSVNPGRVILRNLVRGGGIPKDRIWVVHPRAEVIEGCRAFPSLSALPSPPDTAVVAVPADGGSDRVIFEIAEEGRAHTVVLIPGGFAETEGGRDVERRLREAIDRSRSRPDGGTLVNGGNCLGIISIPGGFNTFLIPPHKLPLRRAPGHNVVSLSQSGAHLVAQISKLDGVVLPRYAVSFGNQIDLTVSDYLEYLEGEPENRVFAVYLEGFQRGDGRRFLAAARRITESGRTVLLYKAGRTREGQVAAASHTAATVGDYDVCRELVAAAGVLECPTLDLLDDLVTTFSLLDGRRADARRTAVLSNAGFECTAAADHLFGLELASLGPETRRSLEALLPKGVVDVHNPLDCTPTTPTDRFVACAEVLAADPAVDALVVAGVPNTPALEDLPKGRAHQEDLERETSLPSRLIRFFGKCPKPVVFSVDAGPLYDPCVQKMRRAGLPCFRKVDRATRALSAFLGRRP